jgi:hypothetical protein
VRTGAFLAALMPVLYYGTVASSAYAVLVTAGTTKPTCFVARKRLLMHMLTASTAATNASMRIGVTAAGQRGPKPTRITRSANSAIPTIAGSDRVVTALTRRSCGSDWEPRRDVGDEPAFLRAHRCAAQRKTTLHTREKEVRGSTRLRGISFVAVVLNPRL